MLKIDGVGLDGITGGLSFLKKVRLREAPTIDGRVLVIGGGNVAIDVALTALRLGSNDVQVACLEKTDEMPAFPWEIEQALEEGVKITTSYGVKNIFGENGRVTTVELMKCLSVFDDEGRFNPKYDENQTRTIKTDLLILAIGQAPDLSWQTPSPLTLTDFGLIETNPSTMGTSLTGVFACGDIVNGPASIVEAVASGRRAALAIDKYLGGVGIIEDKFVETERPEPWLGKMENFAQKPSVKMPSLPVSRRSKNFCEVELGYDKEMALEEASHCLRCDLRMQIREPPKPPDKWLRLEKESLHVVPETEGVYQLLDENEEIICIKGTINVRKDLGQQILTNAKAKYFMYEEAKMYTMRESELLQQFIKRHGKMPEQNLEIDDDLY